MDMGYKQKRWQLRRFLIDKFSLDPKCKGRNAARWEGFWLSHSEVDGIVSEVMEEYQLFHRHQFVDVSNRSQLIAGERWSTDTGE
jgi:hypothetical protein